MALTKELRAQHDIANPGAPGRVTKIPGAVAASQQVNLKYRETGLGQNTGLQRSHPPRFVHFFRKRVDIQHQAAHSAACSRVVQAKSLANAAWFGGKKKGLWLHK